MPVSGTGCEDHRAGLIDPFSGDHMFDVPVIFDGTYFFKFHLCAEACRLLIERCGELEAGGVFDPRIILDLRCVDDLTAVGICLQDQHVFSGAYAVDRRRKSGGTGADDNDVIHKRSLLNKDRK